MRIPRLARPAALALMLAGAAATGAVPAAAQDSLPPGIWTNTEDQYFAEEEGREKPEWFALEVAQDGRWRSVDAFGEPSGDAGGEWQEGPVPAVTARDGGGWQWRGSELRRARPFSCWISVRKFAGKPDGSADWTFAANLPVYDQGGRIFMDGAGIAPDVTLRMRNVTWARGSRNKPSLVIYMHRDDPDRAESYSWTSPDATLVGINLRWVQASCSPMAEPVAEQVSEEEDEN
ncbi:hypothetical protein [Paraurantiacibacter namhicola]|uniref:Secreted protein n=1 Tax=Paraurantiacibacter namhicola TaxID=645517 RepID=A0A1C7D4G7_9SPHN|nr:hypothetical protein [Paraurantiacibacter namhicola]ANU06356.1 hypothetical protein A6F65_00028 [Paraurantiacibacter namhicola]